MTEPIKSFFSQVLFNTETKLGRVFDIILLVLIFASIILVMLESVESYIQAYPMFFVRGERIISTIFGLEYILRIRAAQKPGKYIKSFYGIVDLVSILPSIVSLFFGGTHTFKVIRALRLLRIFRIFKLSRYLGESRQLVRALQASNRKITVFLIFVLIIVTIVGSLMYLIEGSNSGFDSIPKGIYWAIVTITTVGYGDLAPVTPLGQFLASCLMIMGYGVIAVPTGIVSADLATQNVKENGNDDLDETSWDV